MRKIAVQYECTNEDCPEFDQTFLAEETVEPGTRNEFTPR